MMEELPFVKGQESWAVLTGKGARGLGHPGPGVTTNNFEEFDKAVALARNLVSNPQANFNTLYVGHILVVVRGEWVQPPPPQRVIEAKVEPLTNKLVIGL